MLPKKMLHLKARVRGVKREPRFAVWERNHLCVNAKFWFNGFENQSADPQTDLASVSLHSVQNVQTSRHSTPLS